MDCITVGMLIDVKLQFIRRGEIQGKPPLLNGNNELQKTKDNFENNSFTNYYTSLPEVFVFRPEYGCFPVISQIREAKTSKKE
jgi:hypothetical protein